MPHMPTMQLSPLLDSVPDVSYILAGVVAAMVVLSRLLKGSNLSAIPTVGSSSWIQSWWNGRTFRMHAMELIQEGYEKYKTAPFKIADRHRWVVVLGGREHMEEVRKAPDDVLSFSEAANDLVKTKYTIGPEVLTNSYHVEIIRSHLTRSLASLHDEIRDEISASFDGVLNLRGNEWKSVLALRTIQEVVCRTSNRVFVGLPLCREPDWLALNLRYTIDVVNGSHMIDRFPQFMAPLVAYFMTDVPGSMKCGMKHLGPIIEERLKLHEEHGKEYPNKPNDVLSWLLDVAPEGPERTIRSLTVRVLSINFAAIHTSSNSFTHALFLLAENPQYIQPLREEVEYIVGEEGWSKASLGKMHKVDSFLKESQRLLGNSSVSLMRLAVKDFKFSDGTFIPEGTAIVAPAGSLHHDEEYYSNAHVFDPLRFSDMRDEGKESTKHQFVSTNLAYLPFGHGKHACPGRFFAANELKTMLAHIVVSYDVKLEDNKPKPKGFTVGASITPDPFANVMFRKRV